MPKDYYEILGVSRTASSDEIKKNYRRLAKKYHPDVNKGDKASEEKFKEISQAYDILGDVDKRKKYDQFGQWAEQGGFDPSRQARRTWSWTTGGPGGAGGRGGGGPEFDFADLFDFFGGGATPGGRRRSNRPPQESEVRSKDLYSSVDVSFEEAIHGGTRRISILRGGDEERLDVKVPAGIRDGGKIRLAGKGEMGGDLYIKVNVQPHPLFWREDDDLYIEVPVTITEAALGTTTRVTTLSGDVNLKIPPGTSSGQKFRIKGRGAPTLGKSGVGDLYVLVKLVVPPTLDAESIELLKKVHERTAYNPRPGGSGGR